MNAHPIYVVSGGQGSVGEQVVRTALAQFSQNHVPVIVVPGVRTVQQVEAVIQEAAERQGTIVHTMVDGDMREALIDLAREANVHAIDLIGQLLSRLSLVLEREPIGQPGLYRQIHQEYFERIAAIEFTVAHDDGRNIADLDWAEIVLCGVSRVGKTPLSMYLSVEGWKVANVPLVYGTPPPAPLFTTDARRVVGLTIEPGQLIMHRRVRQQRLGAGRDTDYTDPQMIYEELEAARQIFRQGGFAVVDVTDKPIEESGEEVIAAVRRRMSLAK